jgi:hypothetical protein
MAIGRKNGNKEINSICESREEEKLTEIYVRN